MQTTAPTDRFLVHITDVATGQTDTYALTAQQLTWVFGPDLAAKLQAVHAERGLARLRTRRLWAYRRRGLARHCIAFDV